MNRTHMCCEANNNVYAMGQNQSGQCGFPDDDELNISKEFRYVTSLPTIKLLTCGAESTFLVTEANEMYGTGKNENGQLLLGMKDDTRIFTKSRQRVLTSDKVINQIATGAAHTFILVSK
jgi:alpha-tubulin suppressor-like RCC1 family protein